MLGILIYITVNKKSEIHHVYTEKTVVSQTKPNNSADTNQTNQTNQTNSTKATEIPVYPKQLPEYHNTEYQQIGFLSANEVDKDPIILPLFAKRLRNNKDRWQYYTATDKNNMIRLPIVHSNMKCDDDLGCKEIYDGDKLSVEIYQGRIFTATIYKTNSPKYFADVY
jgi:hypothetical protein